MWILFNLSVADVAIVSIQNLDWEDVQMTALTSLQKLKADSHCDSLQWGASHFSIDCLY